jgi:glyoxylase I family protein
MTIELRGMTPLVQVFDMPTSVRFYRDILGFELHASSSGGERSDWVLLRRDEIHLMLNTAYESDSRPPAPDPVRVASHEDASLFFSCPDVDGAYEYLRGRGVTVRQPPTNQAYGMRQLYVTDPDGYVLCFQWPCGDRRD